MQKILMSALRRGTPQMLVTHPPAMWIAHPNPALRVSEGALHVQTFLEPRICSRETVIPSISLELHHTMKAAGVAETGPATGAFGARGLLRWQALASEAENHPLSFLLLPSSTQAPRPASHANSKINSPSQASPDAVDQENLHARSLRECHGTRFVVPSIGSRPRRDSSDRKARGASPPQ